MTVGTRRVRFWVLIGVAVLGLAALISWLAMPRQTATGLASPAAVRGPVLGPTPADRVQRVLFIGGSSGIGLETAKRAIERGHIVTVMSRRASRLEFDSRNLRKLDGDVLDPAAVAAAVQDQDAVVTTVGIAPTRREVTIFSRGMANVLAAIPRGSPTLVIAVTGIGAGDSRGHGGFFYDHVFQPLLVRTIYADKDREEAMLARSQRRYVIVRPAALVDGGSTAPYFVVTGIAGVTAGSISRRQVAEFIVAAIERDLYLRETVLLTR